VSVVDLCQSLLRSDSTPGREREAITIAAEAMRALGYDEVAVDRHGNLTGGIGPSAGPVMVIDGHIDTIPVVDAARWMTSPFSGELSNGHVHGLGSTDMKGPVAAAIYGGAQLASGVPLRGRLQLSISIAEEMTEGATLRRSFDGLRVDYCVIAEPTSLRIAVAQRGRAKVAIDVRGRSAHAAMSEQGVNAIGLMMQIDEALRDLPRGNHPLLGHRDLNMIEINSEPSPSISTIPNRCVAYYDIRFLPGETRESLLSDVRRAVPTGTDADVRFHRAVWTTYVGERYDVEDFAASWEIADDHPLVQAAAGTAGAQLGTYRFCTNGSYFAGERGIPTIGYGPGHQEDAHTVDERISVDELERAVAGYSEIVAAVLRPR